MKNKIFLFILKFLFSLCSFLGFLIFFGLIYLLFLYKLLGIFVAILLFGIYFTLEYFFSNKLKSSENYILNLLYIILISFKISFFTFFFLFLLIYLIFLIFSIGDFFLYNIFINFLFAFTHILWFLLIFIKIFFLIKKNQPIDIVKILVCILIILITGISFYFYQSYKVFYGFVSGNMFKNYYSVQEKIEASNYEKFIDIFGSDKYKDIIKLSEGNFQYKEPLFYIPGKGIDLKINLYYNTLSDYNGVLGNKWSFDYDIFLTKDNNGNMILHSGSQNIFTLYKQKDNSYESLIGRMKLYEEKGIYILNISNKGYVYKFKLVGNKYMIISMSDKNKNTLNFQYNSIGQLIAIKDTFEYMDNQNYIYFDYNVDGKIKEIRDYKGNMTRFKFYEGNEKDGNLYDLKSIDIYKNDEKSRSISYTYFKLGNSKSNIKTINDPSINYFLENKYDDGGKLVFYKTVKGIRYYSYVINEKTGKIKETYVVSREGEYYKYTFNSVGMVKDTVILDSGNNIDIKDSIYEYDDNGNIIKEILPLGNIYNYTYDEYGRVKTKILNEKEGELSITQEYIYIGEKKEPYAIKINGGKIINILSTYPGKKEKYYDNLNKTRIYNIISSINGSGKISNLDLGDIILKFSYNNNKIEGYPEKIDNKENFSIYTEDYDYDINYENNIMVEYTKTDNTLSVNKFILTENGNFVLTKLSYDDNSNIVKMNFGDLGDVYFEYDGLGRLVKLQDVNNNNIYFKYDSGYSLIEIVVNDKKIEL